MSIHSLIEVRGRGVMWTKCFPGAGPRETCLGTSKFTFGRTKRWQSKVRFALRLTSRCSWNFFLAYSYWEADVKVWFRLRFGAACRFHVCKTTLCGCPARRIALAVASFRFWFICCSASIAMDAETLRHASGDMDLLAGSQMWPPQTET